MKKEEHSEHRAVMLRDGSLARQRSDVRQAENAEYVHMDYFHIFWIFVVVSIAGLYIETIVSWPIDGVWKNRAGLVWGPFSPIYGAGAVLMTVALHSLQKSNPFVVFCAAAFVGAAFEFTAGWFFQTAFGIVAWDYSDQPFNLAGHTCLGIAFVWGTVGLLWIKFLMPPVIRLIDRIPQNWRKPLTIIFTMYLAADVAVTLVSFDCWYERTSGQPAANLLQAAIGNVFSDSFMQERFQTMSVFTGLAQR